MDSASKNQAEWMNIRYMGSKRKLAPIVSEILKGLGPGYCVDLFCGMCNVAASLADTVQVIANDIQFAAYSMASTFIATPSSPPKSNIFDKIDDFFNDNFQALKKRFAEEISYEEYWLHEADVEEWSEYLRWCTSVPYVGSDSSLRHEASILRKGQDHFPYRLFSITFPNSYFGLGQCLEIDSLKYAIDRAVVAGSITLDDAKWLMTALSQALTHVASSPGHFAAFLQVRDSKTFDSVRRLRRRKVKDQVIIELDHLRAPGSSSWRSKNVVLNRDALEVVPTLQSLGEISCIYADPPYTSAQYSRFYHVLDTLWLYDYPEVQFQGRYRSDRYMSPFCRLTKVKGAFEQLASSVSSMKTPLLLSYPSTGLLFSTGTSLENILSRYFSSVEVITVDDYSHSTLGASNGQATVKVKEFLILCS